MLIRQKNSIYVISGYGRPGRRHVQVFQDPDPAGPGGRQEALGQDYVAGRHHEGR